MAEMDPNTLMTTDEVADYLHVHPQVVSKWAKEGRIPAAKIGKYWRIRWQDLQAWYDAQLPAQRTARARE